MLRGILTVGGWTMASRLLGFVRDVLTAHLLGAGPVADAFVVANKLPNLFRRLFGEGAFNAAFVPSFSALLHKEGRAAAQRFAEQALAVLGFWLLGLTLLAEIFMPWLMAAVAPGYTGRPETASLVVELGRITFPYMPLICLAALISGVLNSLDRFAAAAAAPVLYNLTAIGFMLGLAGYVPTAGHALAWGVSVSGVFQLGLLLSDLRRAGISLHIPRPRLTPPMRTLLARMGPGLIGAGVTQLNSLVDTVIASLLPDGVQSIIYFADRLDQLPLGTIGVAVGTAMLPALSRSVAAGDKAGALAMQNRAIEYALTLTLPAALALIVIPGPIVGVLFGHGAFSPASVALCAQALAAYAVGLPAFVLVKVLVPAFFARGDTATPVKLGMAAVALNVVLNISFMTPLQHMGPPLASSVAAWFNVGSLLFVLMRRGEMAPDAQLRRTVPRMAVACLAMVAALLLLARAVPVSMTQYSFAGAVALGGLVLAGMLVYAAAGQVSGAFDLKALARRRP